MTRIVHCLTNELPNILNPLGNLTFIESNRQIPFSIQRVYYLYDIPGGAARGGHAHKNLHQYIIAAAGSFDVYLDDGHTKKHFHMNRSYYGLYICPWIWREIDNFSYGSVCLVLASEYFDESDYIRSYDDFLTLRPK